MERQRRHMRSVDESRPDPALSQPASPVGRLRTWARPLAERVEATLAPVTTPLQVAAGALTATTRHTRSLLTPSVLAGSLIEAAWVATHLLTYPIGHLGGRGGQRADHRLEHLPPVQRGLILMHLDAADTPILLVHGLIDNRSIFSLLRLGLSRRGFGSIFAMNWSTLTTDLRQAALALGEEVEQIVAETGYERIHIVGHSLGGLIARYYVTRLGGDERVHTLVTMGTPHGGTYAAYAVPLPVIAQMRPGSGFLAELAEPVPGCRTRFIAYYSDADAVVLPQRNGALRHPDLAVRNVKLHGVGHISLPIVRDVVYGISAALAHLDQEGHTMTAGATPLGRSGRSHLT